MAGASGWSVKPQTRTAALPGGDFQNFSDFLTRIEAQYPFLGAQRAQRMAYAYGTLLHEMLSNKENLGSEFGEGLSEVEVDWLVDREWAVSAEDILFRRTKLGLTIGEDAAKALAIYLERNAK